MRSKRWSGRLLYLRTNRRAERRSISHPAVSKQTQLSSPLPELRPIFDQMHNPVARIHQCNRARKSPSPRCSCNRGRDGGTSCGSIWRTSPGARYWETSRTAANLRTSGESSERDAACARMCLHAKELSMPLLGV
ncbi:hypothetical protein ACHAXT_005132 [Thalassiosira profunda]